MVKNETQWSLVNEWPASSILCMRNVYVYFCARVILWKRQPIFKQVKNIPKVISFQLTQINDTHKIAIRTHTEHWLNWAPFNSTYHVLVTPSAAPLLHIFKFDFEVHRTPNSAYRTVGTTEQYYSTVWGCALLAVGALVIVVYLGSLSMITKQTGINV